MWLQPGHFFAEDLPVGAHPFLRKARDTWWVAEMAAANRRWDNAATRLYYSVYQVCLAFIRTTRVRRPAGHESENWNHRTVRLALGERCGQETENLLDDLLQLRKKADYKETLVTEREVQSLWVDSQTFIGRIRKKIPSARLDRSWR